MFHQLSVLDNVRLGCHRIAKGRSLPRILGSDRATEDAADGKAHDILELFGLRDLSGELFPNLPHGQRPRMAIALAAGPKLALLDEPLPE